MVFTHPVETIVSVTFTHPAPAAPQLTVIELVPCPAVMEPPEIAHRYVLPAFGGVVYIIPTSPAHTLVLPLTDGVGKGLTVQVARVTHDVPVHPAPEVQFALLP